jgi:oligopeptide transport system ATP-binding protein
VVLEARALTSTFGGAQAILGRTVGTVKAVDGVSFVLRRGGTRDSWASYGKTTTARLVLCLERPTAGGIFFRGATITAWPGPSLARYRRAVQAVFGIPTTRSTRD